MSFIRGWWQSMGHWRWLNLLPIAVALSLSVRYEAMPEGWVDHGSVNLGALEVRLASLGTVRAGERLPLRLTVSQPAALQLGFSGQESQTISAAEFAADHQWQAQLEVPDTPNDIATLTVSSAEYQGHWVLGRLVL